MQSETSRLTPLIARRSVEIDCTALCRTLIRDQNAKDLSQVVHNGHELTDDEPDRMVPS